MYKRNEGKLMLELIIAITVVALVSADVVPSLSRFRNEQSLKNAVADVVSLLNKAKSDANSGTVSTDYGVHFESNRAVYFIGTSFTEPNATNEEITLPSAVTIPSSGGITLNGGGNDITFTRLTGDDRGYVTGYGSIIIRLTSDATRQKTITVSRTGAISVN